MEQQSKELRLTPQAVELLVTLDEKGLAYAARDDWNRFVSNMGDSDEANDVRRLLDQLQDALVYSELHEAISFTDLPWATLDELKEAHADMPFEKAEVQAIAHEISKGDPDGIIAAAEEAAGAEDETLKIQVLRERILTELEGVPKLTNDLKTVCEHESYESRGLGYRSLVEDRRDSIKTLIDRSKSYLQNDDATAETGDLILHEWSLARDDVSGLVKDLYAAEQLLVKQDLKFPFPEPREGQMEAALETREALVAGDVVACAPTGFGKSAYSLAAVSGFKGGAYLITPQRVLVRQYEEDFKDVPWVGFLKSRASFKCRCEAARKKRKGPPEDWPTCSDMADACCLGGEDKGDGTCPYVVARDEAMSKPVVVMTAAMATTLMLYQKQRFPMRAVIAVDECQRFEDTLMSACTTTLKYEQLVKDGWTMENDETGGGDPLKWPLDVEFDEHEVKKWLKQWVARASIRLESMSPADLEGHDLKIYRRYDGYVSSLEMAFRFDNNELSLEKRRPHSWKHEPENAKFKVPESFVVKPLSAIGMFDDIMGQAAVRKLLVSATPGTPEYTEQTLGLAYTPQYLEYGSPFPVENRPVVFNPVVRLNYQSGRDDYKKLTDMVVQIATDESDDKWTNHKQQKGIIHTVSNKLHKIVVDALRAAGQGWRIREIKGSYRRLETMEEFEKSSEPLIMIGPAITDGVSLKDDQGRWGIICKLPWPPPVDPSVAYRKDNIYSWYPYQVVLSIIQACGRIVRSKDDWGVNYILDSGFKSLMQRNVDLFPKWFLEAIVEL